MKALARSEGVCKTFSYESSDLYHDLLSREQWLMSRRSCNESSISYGGVLSSGNCLNLWIRAAVSVQVGSP